MIFFQKTAACTHTMYLFVDLGFGEMGGHHRKSQAARTALLWRWPAKSMGKWGFWHPVDMKPLKILLQKLDILITLLGATCMPNFTGIGPGVPAPQIAEI